MSETVETVAKNGTYTDSVNPTKSGYNSGKVSTPIGPTSGAYTTFSNIPLPAQLDGKQVLNAYIEVVTEAWTGSRTLSLQRHAKPTTSYAKMTHNNKPGDLAGSVQHNVTQTGGTTRTWTFDVTADLANIAAGGRYYGWKLRSTTSAAWRMSSWQSQHPPTLVVELSEDALEPVGLRPDGVTALAKPTLTWDAPDGLLSAQAQIDTVGDNFASPLFDTGVVSLTEGELNLARTDLPGGVWAGMSDGASVDVRLRQSTDAGTSIWSDTITMTRDAYPAFSITSPTSATTDPTTTAGWSFAGQDRYQVTITNADKKTIDDSGVIAGADTAWTPDKGAKHAGDVLTYRIRVWDSVDRTTSPGDPGYVEGFRTTTYTPGEAAAVSTLNATQDGVRPWVDLTWTRAAGVPDAWLIIRDGEIIDKIDADTGGPVFEYRDWTCPPNYEVLYEVTPFQEGEAGADGPVVPVRTEVDGAWVIDPGTGRHFSCSGDSLPTYAESSVTYFPVGSSAAVKRTFAMRGLEGSVTGFIDELYDDRTAREQEADLFYIKGAPSAVYRFVGGDLNIPVLVSDLSSVISGEQSDTDRIVKEVSFNVYQVDDLPFPEIVP